MCEYCKIGGDCQFGEKPIFNVRLDFGRLGEFAIEGALWRNQDGCDLLDIALAGYDYETKIAYCPMCGRKLKGAEENV